jgi:Leucine-rich repeat (LRR) protein
LTKLILLQLDGNRLNGNISTELGNISALVGLYMQNNQLTGEIPPSLENLKNLQVLHLYNNHLSGEIPESLADLTNLMDMNLSGNQFSGDFPPQFGNNTYTELFSSLDVHDNQLTVFPDLTNISSLTQFDVSGNNLSFDDILHNLSLLTRYLPQDSIGVALEVKLNQGDDYSIDLGIDEEITDNVYQWFKDGM